MESSTATGSKRIQRLSNVNSFTGLETPKCYTENNDNSMRIIVMEGGSLHRTNAFYKARIYILSCQTNKKGCVFVDIYCNSFLKMLHTVCGIKNKKKTIYSALSFAISNRIQKRSKNEGIVFLQRSKKLLEGNNTHIILVSMKK